MAPKAVHTITSKTARYKWNGQRICSSQGQHHFRFFRFQLSNSIYKENKTFHLLTWREIALPESFCSLSEAQNIFSNVDTEPHKFRKNIYGYGLHSWGYRSVPNNPHLLGQHPNILFIYADEFVTLAFLTHTGQFIVLLFFNRYLKLSWWDAVQTALSVLYINVYRTVWIKNPDWHYQLWLNSFPLSTKNEKSFFSAATVTVYLPAKYILGLPEN